MSSMKATLLFCEGAHDVAFVYHLLKEMLGFSSVSWKFNEYPAPFGDFFTKQIKDHVMKDLSLDMAHKFYLPDLVLHHEEQGLVLVFNSGGKIQRQKVQELIGKLIPLLSSAHTFPSKKGGYISDARFVFLYDADHDHPSTIHSEWQASFKTINNTPWLSDSPLKISADSMGAHSGDGKAVYVWGGQNTNGNGTLEDILLPMLKVDSLEWIDGVSEFVKQMFNWELQHQSPKISMAQQAALKKSIITLIGQYKAPGASMNVVVRYGKLIDKKQIEESARAMSFCKFLEEQMV